MAVVKINVYRGFLRSDGYPEMERAEWTQTTPDDVRHVVLPTALGLGTKVYRWTGGNCIMSPLPVIPPTYDELGNVIDWGTVDLSGPFDLYNRAVNEGFIHVTMADYRVGYEDYRQRVDPVGIPALPTGGAAVLYVNPSPVLL